MGEGIEAKQISTFLLRLFGQDFILSGAFLNKTKILIISSASSLDFTQQNVLKHAQLA